MKNASHARKRTARTKTTRLHEIIDEYRRRIGVRAFTTAEVAKFSEECGLIPVPTVSDIRDVCEAWDRKFDRVKADPIARIEGGES